MEEGDDPTGIALRQRMLKRISSKSDKDTKIKRGSITPKGEKSLKSKKTIDIFKSLDIINKHLSSSKQEQNKGNVISESIKYLLTGKRKIEDLDSTDTYINDAKEGKLNFSYLCDSLDSFSLTSPLRTSIERRFTVTDLDKHTVFSDSSSASGGKIKQSDEVIRNVLSPIKVYSDVCSELENRGPKDSHERGTDFQATLNFSSHSGVTNRNVCLDPCNIVAPSKTNFRDSSGDKGIADNKTLRVRRKSKNSDTRLLVSDDNPSSVSSQDSSDGEGITHNKRLCFRKKSSNRVKEKCDVIEITDSDSQDSDDLKDHAGKEMLNISWKPSKCILRGARGKDKCDVIEITDSDSQDSDDLKDHAGKEMLNISWKPSKCILRGARGKDKCGNSEATDSDTQGSDDLRENAGKATCKITLKTPKCILRGARGKDKCDNSEATDSDTLGSDDLRENAGKATCKITLKTPKCILRGARGKDKWDTSEATNSFTQSSDDLKENAGKLTCKIILKTSKCILRGARGKDKCDNIDDTNSDSLDSLDLNDDVGKKKHVGTWNPSKCILKGARGKDKCDNIDDTNSDPLESLDLNVDVGKKKHMTIKKLSKCVLRGARAKNECNNIEATNSDSLDSHDLKDHAGKEMHKSSWKSIKCCILCSIRGKDKCEMIKSTNSDSHNSHDMKADAGKETHQSSWKSSKCCILCSVRGKEKCQMIEDTKSDSLESLQEKHMTTKKSSKCILRGARGKDKCDNIEATYSDSLDLNDNADKEAHRSTRKSCSSILWGARSSGTHDNVSAKSTFCQGRWDSETDTAEKRRSGRKRSSSTTLSDSRYSDGHDSSAADNTHSGFSYDLNKIDCNRRVFKRIKNTRCYSSLIDIDDVEKNIDDRICGKHDEWISSLRRKIVILGDSHTRFLVYGLQQIFPAFTVQGFCKPSAKCEQVVSGMEDTISRLTKNDFLILLCGTNDMWGHSIDHACHFLSKSLKRIENTNVLVCNVPRNYSESDESHVQDNIRNFNKFLGKTVKDLAHIRLVRLHKLKNKMYFTKHGLHFNSTGKIKICELISHKLVDAIDMINA